MDIEFEVLTPEERCEEASCALREIMDLYNVAYEVDIDGEVPEVYVVPREEVDEKNRPAPMLQ